MSSINGNPAVFTANGNETVSSFTIPFTFKQSGSGTPSLSNVRPITGFTGLTVHYTGKNMLDPQAFAKDSYYATVDDDVITIKRDDERGWVASSDIPSIFLPAGTYVISRTSEAGRFSIRTSLDSYASNLVSTSDASASFTLTDACTVKIKIFSDSYPFDTQLMIESGSTASTYEAYKNDASVYSVTFPALEKNLCPVASETFTQFKRISLGATYPAGTYKFSCVATSSDTDDQACCVTAAFNDTNLMSTVSFLRDERKSVTLTVPSDFNQLALYAANNYAKGAGDTATFSYMQLEEGSTMTDYEPYTNTCYGGTYNALTGVLTVTHKLIAKNTADMDNTESYPGWKHSGIEEIIGHGVNNLITDITCNIGTSIGANTNNNDLLFLATDVYGKTQTEWIALATDVQVCGALQTPYTVQLDPLSSFSFFSGVNTIWTDVNGDITIIYSLSNGIAKIQFKENASATPVVWMDATTATAGASDIIAPKTAMLADGIMTTGTGSGGVTGLIYETGTWTPASDVANATISFSDSHTVAPFAYAIFDVTGTASDTSNDNLSLMYFNGGQYFGEGAYISSSSILYGSTASIYKNSATSDSYGRVTITHPYTDTGDSSSSYSRYWATETSIRAYTGSSSRYWRSGRTYKWVAVFTS